VRVGRPRINYLAPWDDEAVISALLVRLSPATPAVDVLRLTGPFAAAYLWVMSTRSVGQVVLYTKNALGLDDGCSSSDARAALFSCNSTIPRAVARTVARFIAPGHGPLTPHPPPPTLAAATRACAVVCGLCARVAIDSVGGVTRIFGDDWCALDIHRVRSSLVEITHDVRTSIVRDVHLAVVRGTYRPLCVDGKYIPQEAGLVDFLERRKHSRMVTDTSAAVARAVVQSAIDSKLSFHVPYVPHPVRFVSHDLLTNTVATNHLGSWTLVKSPTHGALLIVGESGWMRIDHIRQLVLCADIVASAMGTGEPGLISIVMDYAAPWKGDTVVPRATAAAVSRKPVPRGQKRRRQSVSAQQVYIRGGLTKRRLLL